LKMAGTIAAKIEGAVRAIGGSPLWRIAFESRTEELVSRVLAPVLRDSRVRQRYRIGKRFLEAVRRHFPANVGHPMYDTWLEFALSTNVRGEAAAEMVKGYRSVSGSRVLDIGCAYGGFPIAFARSGAEAVGIDINPGLLKLAAENMRDMRVPVSLYRKDITDSTQIADLQDFDIITCNDLIEHVEDVRATLENIASLLRPGGLLYLQIPNACSVRQVLKDGHYGLFGITLLSRQDAIRYFAESGYNDSYGVGNFHSLDEYLGMLVPHRIALHDGEISNSFEYLKERIDQMSPSLELIRGGLSRCLGDDRLSVKTKQALADALNGYLAQACSDLEVYHGMVDEALKARRARSLVKRYEIEFWELICVKAS